MDGYRLIIYKHRNKLYNINGLKQNTLEEKQIWQELQTASWIGGAQLSKCEANCFPKLYTKTVLFCAQQDPEIRVYLSAKTQAYHFAQTLILMETVSSFLLSQGQREHLQFLRLGFKLGI